MSFSSQNNSGGHRFFDLRIPSRISAAFSRPSTLIGSAFRNEYIEETMEYNQNSQPQDQVQSNNQLLNGGLVPAGDKLAIFRTMVGIDNAPALNNLPFSTRPVPNIGIYGRVTKAEKKACFRFKVYSMLINGALGLQIVFAAALTALGAGNGPHALVTIFGAINIVIAGFLTYLKGSGLPHKLKYYENEWSKIREYIEQCERDLCRENCTLDVEEVVREIELMYDEVKSDIEMNASDGIVSMGEMQKRRNAQIPKSSNNNVRQPLSRAVSFNVKGHGSMEHCPNCMNPMDNHKASYSTYPAGTGSKIATSPIISPVGTKEKGDPSHMV